MKRRQSEQDKKLADDARLLRAWKAFHSEERETVLAGPYGAVLNELFRMFANLEHVQPVQLVGYTRAIDWSEIDYPTRLTVIHEANAAITKRREKQGREPIDDPLPGTPPSAFQIIRELLTTKLPASSRARPTRRGPYPGGKSRTVRL